MNTPKIVIMGITPTKSDEVFKVELYQETPRINANNSAISLFMDGHSSFNTVSKARVWPSFTPQQIKKLGIEEGKDLNECLAPEGFKARLRIIESVGCSYDDMGELNSEEQHNNYSRPKLNMSKEGVVMQVDGEDIYRSTVVEMVPLNAEFSSDILLTSNDERLIDEVIVDKKEALKA